MRTLYSPRRKQELYWSPGLLDIQPKGTRELQKCRGSKCQENDRGKLLSGPSWGDSAGGRWLSMVRSLARRKVGLLEGGEVLASEPGAPTRQLKALLGVGRQRGQQEATSKGGGL